MLKFCVYRLQFILLLVFCSVTVLAQPDYFPEKKGQYISYYSGSKHVKCSGKYRNHKKHGVWNYWFVTGEISLSEQYADGILHGLRFELNIKGDTLVSEHFVNGVKEGRCMKFLIWNRSKEIANYKDGKQDGETSFYLESGMLWRIQLYEKGDLRENKDYAFGSLISSRSYYKSGKKEGDWVYFSFDITTRDTVYADYISYLNDKRTGKHVAYRNKKLTVEEFYQNDVLHGRCRKWTPEG
ncbi:MAG: hypothetical protein ACRC3B_09555, partial [Bacteroidia bacterium]